MSENCENENIKKKKKVMHNICMTNHAILHGLVVMAVDSQHEGPGLEYQSSQNLFCHFLTHLRLYNQILVLDKCINNFKIFSTNIYQLLRDPRGPKWKIRQFWNKVEPNVVILHKLRAGKQQKGQMKYTHIRQLFMDPRGPNGKQDSFEVG